MRCPFGVLFSWKGYVKILCIGGSDPVAFPTWQLFMHSTIFLFTLHFYLGLEVHPSTARSLGGKRRGSTLLISSSFLANPDYVSEDIIPLFILRNGWNPVEIFTL
jgi:hypothetical protein